MIKDDRCKFKVFRIDLSEETDASIGVICVVILFLLTDYLGKQLNVDWFVYLYSVLALTILLLFFQFHGLVKSIMQFDYIKISRKVVVSFLLSCTSVLLVNVPSVYKSFDHASRQPILTYKLPTRFTRTKGRYFSYHASYSFDGQRRLLEISKQEAKEMEQGQKQGIEYCLLLSLQKGLRGAYLLNSYKIESCN